MGLYDEVYDRAMRRFHAAHSSAPDGRPGVPAVSVPPGEIVGAGSAADLGLG
jgi:hypothetical protein